MTAQTRERLVNSLITVCICIIFSLFVIYTSKGYTNEQINLHEKKETNMIYDKLNQINSDIDSISIKLDYLNNN
jgi:membrane protein CcdC involved in cytochrome C biogenesis